MLFFSRLEREYSQSDHKYLFFLFSQQIIFTVCQHFRLLLLTSTALNGMMVNDRDNYRKAFQKSTRRISLKRAWSYFESFWKHFRRGFHGKKLQRMNGLFNTLATGGVIKLCLGLGLGSIESSAFPRAGPNVRSQSLSRNYENERLTVGLGEISENDNSLHRF